MMNIGATKPVMKDTSPILTEISGMCFLGGIGLNKPMKSWSIYNEHNAKALNTEKDNEGV